MALPQIVSDQPVDQPLAPLTAAGADTLPPDVQPVLVGPYMHGVGGTIEPPDSSIELASAGLVAPNGWLHLRVIADTLDDIMRTRIAVTNRVERAAIEGFAAEAHLAGLLDTENRLKLALKRQFRVAAPEVRKWTLDTIGLGEPLMARLLGAVGDPLIAQPYYWDTEAPEHHVCGPTCGDDRHLIALPSYRRTPRQLLSYCGWGDPARKRRKGMTAEDAMLLGKQNVKPLAYVMAECCIKQNGGVSKEHPLAVLGSAPLPTSDPSGATTTAVPNSAGQPFDGESDRVSTAKVVAVRRRSPYRDVYDEGRERYATRPDWTLGHQHSAAVRLTVKAILIDLWRVSAGQEPKHPQVN